MDLILALIMCLLMVWLRRVDIARCKELLNEWATTNQFTITEAKRRIFFTGPFRWRPKHWDVIFHVTVQDERNGCLRRCYVQCQAQWLYPKSVEVIWD